MKMIFRKILICLFSLLILSGCNKSNTLYVSRDDWALDVKVAINDFIDMYGNNSSEYSDNSYVVFDFDNTCSIFDMCEQFMIYQAEVMGYGFNPEELPTILSSGLGDMNEDLSSLGYGNGSYNDWIFDITNAYTYLYNAYGPFTPSGVSKQESIIIKDDPMWLEFVSKMMNMYFLIGDNESTDISYPWITYWYEGMSEQEVYELSKASHHIYKEVDTSYKTITSPSTIDSKVGVTSYTYVEGVQVSENIKELWKALDTAGIDVWVCSASEANIIRSAIDEFGLHEYCTGLIGMTPTKIDGLLSHTYDYDTGYCWYAKDNGGRSRGNVSSSAQTQAEGKVTAIKNICFKDYGVGPLAGFMDSSGDYNFCTEFENLKLVICFNRANRSVYDGGSIIAELAMYQKDILNYDLKKANENCDTLYVLQGRDENGKRALRNSNATIRLNDSNEKLFKDERNEMIYNYIVDNGLTTEDIINKFCIKSDDNELGFSYGYLDSYAGYHSIK